MPVSSQPTRSSGYTPSSTPTGRAPSAGRSATAYRTVIDRVDESMAGALSAAPSRIACCHNGSSRCWSRWGTPDAVTMSPWRSLTVRSVNSDRSG